VQVTSIPLDSEEAAMRAAQVPEQRPCRRILNFLCYEWGSQNTFGQAAHHILVKTIRFYEVLVGVLGASELFDIHREGHGVELVVIIVLSSKYQDVVGLIWSAALAKVK